MTPVRYILLVLAILVSSCFEAIQLVSPFPSFLCTISLA